MSRSLPLSLCVCVFPFVYSAESIRLFDRSFARFVLFIRFATNEVTFRAQQSNHLLHVCCVVFHFIFYYFVFLAFIEYFIIPILCVRVCVCVRLYFFACDFFFLFFKKKQIKMSTGSRKSRKGKKTKNQQ